MEKRHLSRYFFNYFSKICIICRTLVHNDNYEKRGVIMLFSFYVTIVELVIFHIFACKFSKRKLLDVELSILMLFIVIMITFTAYHHDDASRMYQVFYQIVVIVYFAQFFKKDKLSRRIETSFLAYSFSVMFLTLVQPLLIKLLMYTDLDQTMIFAITKSVSLVVALILYRVPLLNEIYNFCIRHSYAKFTVYFIAIVSAVIAIYANFDSTRALLMSVVLLVAGTGFVGVVGFRKVYRVYHLFSDEMDGLEKGVSDEEILRRFERRFKKNEEVD